MVISFFRVFGFSHQDSPDLHHGMLTSRLSADNGKQRPAIELP